MTQMREDMLTLYYRPGTCAMAAYLALQEAGADYRAVDVSAQPELLARVNPRGKVPALGVGGQILRENVAILCYVAQRFPGAGLLPEEPLAKAQCLSTVAWFASTLHIDYRRFIKPFVYSPDSGAHEAISAEGARQYRLDLTELDGLLRDGRWLHGAQRSIADLYGLVFVDWALRSGLYDLQWQGIGRWVEQLRQRPAVRHVLEQTGSPLAAGLPHRFVQSEGDMRC